MLETTLGFSRRLPKSLPLTPGSIGIGRSPFHVHRTAESRGTRHLLLFAFHARFAFSFPVDVKTAVMGSFVWNRDLVPPHPTAIEKVERGRLIAGLKIFIDRDHALK